MSAAAVVAMAGMAWGQGARKPRVYVSATAVTSGHFRAFGIRGTGAGSGASGVDPQRDELVKTVLQRCPQVLVTVDQGRADYDLNLQREPNKSVLHKRNKWLLTDRAGDVIAAGSDRSLGGVAKDACKALQRRRSGSI